MVQESLGTLIDPQLSRAGAATASMGFFPLKLFNRERGGLFSNICFIKEGGLKRGILLQKIQ